jgi:hypothetical protein
MGEEGFFGALLTGIAVTGQRESFSTLLLESETSIRPPYQPKAFGLFEELCRIL